MDLPLYHATKFCTGPKSEHSKRQTRNVEHQHRARQKNQFFYLKVPLVDHLGNHGSQVAWQLPTPPRTNESDAYMKSEQNPFQKEQLIEYQWISLIGGHFFLFFSHLGNHESQKAPLQTHLRN